MKKTFFLFILLFFLAIEKTFAYNDDKIMSFEFGLSYSTFKTNQHNYLVNFGTSIYHIDFDLSTTVKMKEERKYGYGNLTDDESQIIFYGGYRFPIYLDDYSNNRLYIVPLLGFYHSRYLFEDSYYGHNMYKFKECEFSYGGKIYYCHNYAIIGAKITSHLIGFNIGIIF